MVDSGTGRILLVGDDWTEVIVAVSLARQDSNNIIVISLSYNLI